MNDRPQRIFGTLRGDFTGATFEFDATDRVLGLDLEALHALADHDYSTDHLAPETVKDRARELFRAQYGEGRDDLRFGYEVTVVASICAFFGVETLEAITRPMLDRARARITDRAPGTAGGHETLHAAHRIEVALERLEAARPGAGHRLRQSVQDDLAALVERVEAAADERLRGR